MAKWYTLGYITGCNDAKDTLALPFDMGGGVSLIEVPHWAKKSNVLRGLDNGMQECIRKKCRYALCTEYQAEALGSLCPGARGKAGESIQKAAKQRVFLAWLALWLAKPTSMDMELIVHFDEVNKLPEYRQSSKTRGFRYHKRDARNAILMSDLRLGHTLNMALASIGRGSTMWTAIRLVFRAMQEEMWELRYLLMWVAMESLFGASSPQETTFRLSLRAACFLAESKDGVRTMFDLLKESYSWRSKVVHGCRLGKLTGAKSTELSHNLEDTIRKGLLKILQDAEIMKKFQGQKRDEYLDSLIFRNGASDM